MTAFDPLRPVAIPKSRHPGCEERTCAVPQGHVDLRNAASAGAGRSTLRQNAAKRGSSLKRRMKGSWRRFGPLAGHGSGLSSREPSCSPDAYQCISSYDKWRRFKRIRDEASFARAPQLRDRFGLGQLVHSELD